MSVFSKNGAARLRALCALALLTAAEILLSRFLSFQQLTIKFSFAFVAVMLAGRYFGPLGGALCGGLADFVGALLFPIGAYHPGFTLTAVLVGAVYGLCFRNGYTLPRVLLAVGFSQVVGTLLLNTYWVSTLAGVTKSFGALLITRLPEFAVMGVLMVLVAWLLLPRLDRALLPLLRE